jgi:hypothetical protein
MPSPIPQCRSIVRRARALPRSWCPARPSIASGPALRRLSPAQPLRIRRSRTRTATDRRNKLNPGSPAPDRMRSRGCAAGAQIAAREKEETGDAAEQNADAGQRPAVGSANSAGRAGHSCRVVKHNSGPSEWHRGMQCCAALRPSPSPSPNVGTWTHAAASPFVHASRLIMRCAFGPDWCFGVRRAGTIRFRRIPCTGLGLFPISGPPGTSRFAALGVGANQRSEGGAGSAGTSLPPGSPAGRGARRAAIGAVSAARGDASLEPRGQGKEKPAWSGVPEGLGSCSEVGVSAEPPTARSCSSGTTRITPSAIWTPCESAHADACVPVCTRALTRFARGLRGVERAEGRAAGGGGRDSGRDPFLGLRVGKARSEFAAASCQCAQRGGAMAACGSRLILLCLP